MFLFNRREIQLYDTTGPFFETLELIRIFYSDNGS